MKKIFSLIIIASLASVLCKAQEQTFKSEYTRFIHCNVRGSLANSYLKFEKGPEARVAFLGGSITEMKGWKDIIEEYLQERFPDTEFDFVEAGVASTGTTPGAFRLQHDVLSRGKIDLLFVEAAVNDDTNGFNDVEQIRGMEGEIRHALLSNPQMDIVMLHFIYDPFIPMVARGETPKVIDNHEKVAGYYNIPSINLVQEIGERMLAGEFTWEQFGGTHPLPFGHKYYASAIEYLFSQMWQHIPKSGKCENHPIPAHPLDRYSYFGGDFIDLSEAKLGKGWQYVASWNPDDNCGKRQGFVNVPMLEGKGEGSRLKLKFSGSAIGIFCTPGATAGTLEFSIDGAPFKKLDTFTEWSEGLYIPWVYVFESELENKNHKLVLKISSESNPKSIGHECQIRNFVVNK